VTGPPSDDLAATLFEKYQQPLRRYLRFASGSADLADDLTQDVFLRVVRGADGYQPRERERAWLFRIARNLVTDHARRQVTRREDGQIRVEPIRAAVQPQLLSVREALARLTDQERQAFLLCEIGGLSYAELADVLGLTAAAIRSLLYRVRMELRASVLRPPHVVPSHSFQKDRSDDFR
jgi:RNA polymerase sigma-70 factor (ECF subfamily)